MEWKGDMADVAAICGDDVAEELSRVLPGITLYVPKSESETSPLMRINVSIAERLRTSFGGDTIYVSSLRPSSEERFEAIQAFIDKGYTVQEAALKVGISERWARKCRELAGSPKITKAPDPRQLTFLPDNDEDDR